MIECFRDHLTSEKLVRNLLLTLGILALIIGLLWIGQGTGTFPYPASSFMISQIQWTYYGAALAVVGGIMIWRGRR
jgi:uncharacterized membrane protein